MSGRASTYFFFQAIAVVVWWTLLISKPSFRNYFFPASIQLYVTTTFHLPDILVIIASSITGMLSLQNKVAAKSAALLTTGALAYAKLICVTWMFSDAIYFAAILMFAATAMSAYFARELAESA